LRKNRRIRGVIMKILIFIFIIPFCLYGQTKEYYQHKIDSVKQIQKDLKSKISQLDKEIKNWEREIVKLTIKSAVMDCVATTTKLRVNFRSDPSPFSDIIRTIERNDTVYVRGYDDDYFLCKSNGRHGYILASDLYSNDEIEKIKTIGKLKKN